jgi:isoaspartyl peptidase/L-asparaginase-like protein (Ntn-hydrolase superfamily)
MQQAVHETKTETLRETIVKPNRRQVLVGAAWVIGGYPLGRQLVASEASEGRPVVISTWPFGKEANEKALSILLGGGSTLDAVEQGIRVTESSGNASVGLSGKPNAAGYVQLDACIMHGPGHQAGAVGALEGFAHPISVARRVMEKTPHVMLVGEGARWFALEEGFVSVDIREHREKASAWRSRDQATAPDAEAEPAPNSSPKNHDTITLLVRGADGTLSGGCSTSGLADKLPGRVGDSPIIGSGLYVDNEVGAAGATGVGENVMRYCGAYLIVELMRQGMDPTAACQTAIRRIAAKDPRGWDLGIHFIALDKQGRFGAAGTKDFPHSVTYPGFSQVLTAPATTE